MMPRSCWLPACLCVWWLLLMLTGAQEQQRHSGCPPKMCGNLTISHPFWLKEIGAQRPCEGHSDFETTCQNNTLVLPSSVPLPWSFGFAIVDISYEERSLHVVDMGKLRLLQASNSCRMPMWNTSDKLGIPFRIDPVNQNLTMYNCTKASAARRDDKELVETRMRCGNESQVYVRTEGSYGETSTLEGCGAGVILPVLGGANGEANASDYERLIRDGFILRWGWEEHDRPLARKFTRLNHVLSK
ncbi:unnamed protein product [Alopecurus aequalis]